MSLLGLAGAVLASAPAFAQSVPQKTGVDATREAPLPAPSALQGLPAEPIAGADLPKSTFTPAKIVARVESTELGYEKSVAPSPGRKVNFKGRQYQVAEVVVAGGGPMLLANHYVIGIRGSSLIVGLKEVDPLDDLTN